MACKVLTVKQCGPIDVNGIADVIAGLEAINNTLNAEVVVQPGDEWAAILEAATTAALENADIEVTIDSTTPVSVVIDTTAGPVEITGSVTVDGTVSVDNFPTEFAVSNFADLEGLELTVTLDGETVTVTPDQAFIDELDDIVNAIESAIRVDYEETGMCGYDADGNLLDPPVKQFVERRYSHTGLFLGSDVVLSQYAADGTITGYALGAGEVIRACRFVDTEQVECPAEVVAVATDTLVGRDLTPEENAILPASDTIRNFAPWKPENVKTPPFPTGRFVDTGGAASQTGGYNDGAANVFRTRVFPLNIEPPKTCNGVEGDLAVEVTIDVTGHHTTPGSGNDVFIYIVSGPDTAPVIEDTITYAGASLIGTNTFTSSVVVSGATAQTLRAFISLQTYESATSMEFEVNFFAIAGEAEPCTYDAKIVHDPCALTLQKRLVEQNDQIIALLSSVIGDPDDECPCNSDEANVFYIPAGANESPTKYNLDDPAATNAYGSVNSNGWTSADLAAALNADAANAVPPTVPSGVDYSTTTWNSGSNANGDYVFVDSGPIPATLDLVSVPVSIPVSTL